LINDDEGVRYTVQVNGGGYEVINVDHGPNKKQYHLRCASSLPTFDAELGSPFDRYGRVNSALQGSILDNFANRLISDDTLKGIVLVYAGEKERLRDATKTAQEIRRFLGHRGISHDRLSVKQTGRKQEFMVELYLLRKK
jgi:hypothetical protein